MKDLFWLVVSKIPVHGHQTPFFELLVKENILAGNIWYKNLSSPGDQKEGKEEWREREVMIHL